VTAIEAHHGNPVVVWMASSNDCMACTGKESRSKLVQGRRGSSDDGEGGGDGNEEVDMKALGRARARCWPLLW